MSTYQGQLPDKSPFAESDIHVTVDGQPLPFALAEVPGIAQSFGWGSFSAWAGKKLLAYSILRYELHDVMHLPSPMAHRYLLDIADLFMDDQVSKFDRQWTLSSEQIGRWIEKKYPNIWQELHRTPA